MNNPTEKLDSMIKSCQGLIRDFERSYTDCSFSITAYKDQKRVHHLDSVAVEDFEDALYDIYDKVLPTRIRLVVTGQSPGMPQTELYRTSCNLPAEQKKSPLNTCYTSHLSPCIW